MYSLHGDKKFEANHAIDIMRTVAWCAELVKVSGKTELELKNYPFDRNGESYDFPLYSVGAQIPRIETVDIVENSEETPTKKESEAQNGKSAAGKQKNEEPRIKTCGTKQVFATGPENLPLWALLADECDEDLCMDTIRNWLVLRRSDTDAASLSKTERESDLRAMKSLPFHQVASLAWHEMIGDTQVDFEQFEEGNEPHHLWMPWLDIKKCLKEFGLDSDNIRTVRDVERLIESPDIGSDAKDKLVRLKDIHLRKLPSLDDAIGVIAFKRLAESRRECQSEARYLFLGTLYYMGSIFAEWNIAQLLCSFLEPWSRARISPDAVALQNENYGKTTRALRTQLRDNLSKKEELISSTMLNRLKR